MKDLNHNSQELAFFQFFSHLSYSWFEENKSKNIIKPWVIICFNLTLFSFSRLIFPNAISRCVFEVWTQQTLDSASLGLSSESASKARPDFKLESWSTFIQNAYTRLKALLYAFDVIELDFVFTIMSALPRVWVISRIPLTQHD